MDEIGHDQEVAGIFHFDDDPELELEAGLILGDGEPFDAAELFQAVLEAGISHLAQSIRFRRQALGLGLIGRRRKARQDWTASSGPIIHPLGDFDRIFKRFRQIGKQLGHFGTALEIMLIGELAPLGLGHHGARGNRQQGIVGLKIPMRREERLIGRHQRHAAPIGIIDQLRLIERFL